MGRKTLYDLLCKYREGRCTPDELDKLNVWYEEFTGEVEHISVVPDEKLDQLFYGIECRINGIPKRRKSSTILRWAGAVACAAVVAAIIYIFYTSGEKDEPSSVSGSWQAELIVGGGEKILLDSTPLIEEGGRVVAENTERGLEYSTTEDVGEVYHTIVVGVGHEFGLTLSDGSRVRLNSGSTLTYPVSFGEDRREVKLNGEAYFDVVRSSVPFIVNAVPVEVKVLGTSFNVTAYDDDPYITATLVTGSVSVHTAGQEEGHMLDPGYQLSYDKATEKVTTRKYDPDIVTAWIHGEFKFRDMHLDEIMKRLSRWYDYQIRFDDESLKHLRFSGAAEKHRPIEYVLEMIEYVTDINFDIDSRTIVVKRK